MSRPRDFINKRRRELEEQRRAQKTEVGIWRRAVPPRYPIEQNAGSESGGLSGFGSGSQPVQKTWSDKPCGCEAGHHEVADLEAASEVFPPKVTLIHRIARKVGKEGGEAAVDPNSIPYDWTKTVTKGAKATGGTAIVLMAVIGFARGMGIELWNPESDEAAVVILVGASSLLCGLWKAVSNWFKHRKNGA